MFGRYGFLPAAGTTLYEHPQIIFYIIGLTLTRCSSNILILVICSISSLIEICRSNTITFDQKSSLKLLICKQILNLAIYSAVRDETEIEGFPGIVVKHKKTCVTKKCSCRKNTCLYISTTPNTAIQV